jgi:hypothetical protein
VAHARCPVARYIIDEVQDVYRLQGLKENVIVGRLIPAGTDLA